MLKGPEFWTLRVFDNILLLYAALFRNVAIRR